MEGSIMPQSPLLSLAMELIFAICCTLKCSDLKCFRLTCKYLAEALAPLVLRHITTSTKKDLTVPEFITDLQDLNHAAFFCTRQITIEDLPSATLDSKQELRGPFFKALTSLKSVKTVIWFARDKFLQETIWKAILGLGPNLLHLTIHAQELECPLDEIESLFKLESISFLNTPWMDDAFVFSAVSNLYASSTTLKSIVIKRDDFLELPYPSLHQLFSYSANTPPGPRPLRHLEVTECFIRLDEVTLPHLTNLTSLKWGTRLPSPDSKHSLDAMWTALKVSDIHLEELDLGENTVAASLVDYLSTYSGLRKLRMNFIGSAATVARFWSAAFPRHIHTLEDFALYEGDNGEWCCFAVHFPLISQCKKLKFLMLSVVQRSEGGSTNWGLILYDAKILIDMTITYLLLLEHLQLQVAIPGGSLGRRIRQGGPEGMICDWIPKYKLPSSCQYLPQLSVGWRNFPTKFVGIRNDHMNLA